MPPLVNGVEDLSSDLPGYADDLRKNETFRDYDDRYHITEKLREQAQQLPSKLGDAAGTLRDVTVGVFTRFVQLFSILVMTFFLVKDGHRLLEFFYRQVPPERARRMRKIADDISDAISGYVLGNFVISVLAGLVTFVTLQILDVPFATPLAILFGFFDLIPLVGATLGGILVGIVVAFAADFPLGLIVWVAVLILYQQVENNLIQPFVYGRAVQLHPLIVIVAILIGAALLGVLGALLAIPAAAAVQAVIRDYWHFRQGRAAGPVGEGQPRRGAGRGRRQGFDAQPRRSRRQRGEERTPPKPIMPGPMWAPITGPTSETNAGSESKMSRHSSTRWRAVSWSWTCWTTQASAPSAWRWRAYSTIRSKARRRVRTRSTGVISSPRVRIGLI